jgi:site-specific recombinase XerD
VSTVTRTREPKNLDAGPYAATIRSFQLHLNAEGKSPKTVRTYVEAVQWFAAAPLAPAGGRGDWSAVTAEDVNIWLVRLLDTYSDSYANNQFRALQQFFKWHAEDEEVPSPMARLKPPKVRERSSRSSPTRS